MMSMNAVHGASLNLNTTEIIQANDEEVLGENLSEYTESLFATTKYVYTSDSISNEELLLVELDDEPVLDTLEMPEELEDEKALNVINLNSFKDKWKDRAHDQLYYFFSYRILTLVMKNYLRQN